MTTPPAQDDLPVHFFTIVLNGEPFIRYHIEAFRDLPFSWHWHIVEGVARLVHDTAWSLPTGGNIPDTLHDRGLSNDGTTAWLDQLKAAYPKNISIYRKPSGEFWEGKLEMVNAPLQRIPGPCLLWQVDSDELWSRAQIVAMRDMFLAHPEKTAALFWCHYFVGPNLVVSSRNCYTQNPRWEWLRVWRYQPGMKWAAHEPPRLIQDSCHDVGKIDPFLHHETERRGLVFQHFAYAIERQLEFKEAYYGYAHAVRDWRRLNRETSFPVLLKNYFSWVHDETRVDSVQNLGLAPIASPSSGPWHFPGQDAIKLKEPAVRDDISPRIVVDGAFFEIAPTGISRVWTSLLREWAKSDFAPHVLVLNRNKTAPIFPNLRYRDIPSYSRNNLENDSLLLQLACDDERADLFISTYTTTPLRTPTVYLLHDMVAELLGHDPDSEHWIEKTFAILNARSWVAVSKNSARDLHFVHPQIPLEEIIVAYPGVDELFQPATEEAVAAFKKKHALAKPYYLVVGTRGAYKNIYRFFQAFAQMPDRDAFEIVCAGGKSSIERELLPLVDRRSVHHRNFSDPELALAYAGAVALVYPSLYEGFGLPVLEAMASGCPVITSRAASLPEVAGDAALYVDPTDLESLRYALREVQRPEVRQPLIQAGLRQARLFSWAKMAGLLAAELKKTAKKIKDQPPDASSHTLKVMRNLMFKMQAVRGKKETKRERHLKMKLWGKHRLKVSLYQ